MSNTIIVVPEDLNTPICSESPHFTWKEVFASTAATKHNVSNLTTDQFNLGNIVATAKQMEIVRNLFGGAAITVNSWFRNEVVNKLVGGTNTSEHRLGSAVDFTVKGYTPEEVYCKIAASDIVFNQLIQEYNTWTHYSFKSYDYNKNSPMRFTRDKNGKTIKNYEDRKKYKTS